MNGRLLLAGLAIAVVGALAFLIISAKSGSSDGSASTAGKDSDNSSGFVSEAQAAERQPDARRMPRRMKGDERSKPGDAYDLDTGDHRDYVRAGGTPVRDHRTKYDGQPDLDRAPNVHIKRGKVKPDVIVAVRNWLRPKIAKCSADYAGDISAGAKVDVRLQVSITGGVVTVGRAVVNPRKISGADFAVCIEQAVKTMELSVSQDEDVEHHMLTFPFPLPIK